MTLPYRPLLHALFVSPSWDREWGTGLIFLLHDVCLLVGTLNYEFVFGHADLCFLSCSRESKGERRA